MNYSILIIEDETETSKYLSLALTDEGFDVVCAENGTKGLALLREQAFDMIILDLQMPGMYGDKVLKEIRVIAPYVLVIVYTNNGNIEVMETLMNLGVDGFAKKGATADLFKIVEMVKAKLHPISEEARKTLLDKFLNQITNPFDNEVHS
jgi:DNA-binding response OmpR family regulator